MTLRLPVALAGSAAVLLAGGLTWAHLDTTDTRLLPYEGYLDLDGQAVTGQYDFRFALSTSGSPGDADCLSAATPACPASIAYWTEHDAVAVNRGAFSAVLGENKGLTDEVLNAGDLYLAIAVRSSATPSDPFSVLQNKQHVLGAPYAARAAAANNFKVTGNLQVGGAVSPVATNADLSLKANGTGRVAINNGSGQGVDFYSGSTLPTVTKTASIDANGTATVMALQLGTSVDSRGKLTRIYTCATPNDISVAMCFSDWLRYHAWTPAECGQAAGATPPAAGKCVGLSSQAQAYEQHVNWHFVSPGETTEWNPNSSTAPWGGYEYWCTSGAGKCLLSGARAVYLCWE